jgi:hypothetical protein
VSFDIDESVAKNTFVAELKHDWQNIIAGVYEAMPLAELMTDKLFARSYKYLQRSEA